MEYNRYNRWNYTCEGDAAMGMHKYPKDYRMENVTGRNGKTRTTAVYCGSYHAFTQDSERVRACARSFAYLATAQVALILMALFTNAGCSRVFYVMVPFAFLLPPVFLICAGAVNLMLAKDKFTRETKDHIAFRTRKCPIIAMILSAISALAHIPYAIAYGETARDMVYLAAALGVFASALAQYKLSSRFATAEVESARAE